MAATAFAGDTIVDMWGNVLNTPVSIDIHRMDVFMVFADSINNAWSGFSRPMVNGQDLLGL